MLSDKDARCCNGATERNWRGSIAGRIARHTKGKIKTIAYSITLISIKNISHNPFIHHPITRQRVAKAWLDMTSGTGRDSKSAFGNALFTEPLLATSPDGMVIVRDISFASLNEHILLPFHGRCHIAYLPKNGVILGLSKLARVTRLLASRIQSQSALTASLLAAVSKEVRPLGIAVIVQATHLGHSDDDEVEEEGIPLPSPLCRVKPNNPVLTAAVGGLFAHTHTLNSNGLIQECAALLGIPFKSLEESLLHNKNSNINSNSTREDDDSKTTTTEPPSTNIRELEEAVTCLIQGVGDTPDRPGLVGSEHRYITWLQSATAGYSMSLEPSPTSVTREVVRGGRDDDGTPSTTILMVHDDSSENSPICVDNGGGSSSLFCDDTSSDDVMLASPPPPPALGTAATCIAGIERYMGRFMSQCEHHLLPFYGTVRIAFQRRRRRQGDGDGLVVGNKSGNVGTSNGHHHENNNNDDDDQNNQILQYIVDVYSKRLQVQERLGQQIADAVMMNSHLQASEVLVLCESAHMCMVARGVEEHASSTVTTAARGGWASSAQQRGIALRALLAQ